MQNRDIKLIFSLITTAVAVNWGAPWAASQVPTAELETIMFSVGLYALVGGYIFMDAVLELILKYSSSRVHRVSVVVVMPLVAVAFGADVLTESRNPSVKDILATITVSPLLGVYAGWGVFRFSKIVPRALSFGNRLLSWLIHGNNN